MSQHTATTEQLCTMFKALGDPVRLRLFALLTREELCVCHLTEALALPQSTVSRHLGVLRQAALVATRREGKWMYYRLAESLPPQLAALTAAVAETVAPLKQERCTS